MKKVDYALDVDELKNLGVTISKFRTKLRDLALEMHKKDALWIEVEIHDITVMADRMNRGYFKGQHQQKNVYFRDFVEDTTPGSRKRGRRRKPLTCDDKIKIVYKALCKDELRKDVAREMRVTP